MAINNRQSRSVTFDQSAENYQAARPSYPDEAITALIDKTGLAAQSHCLEVGVGTGQATRKLAPLGCSITGLEPGGQLAKLATSVLSAFQNVNIVNQSYEAYSGEPGSFDLLYSATAFHWTDRETRWQKAARLVRIGGHLALLVNMSMEGRLGTEFFLAAQPIYKKYVEADAEGFDAKNTTIAVSTALAEELEANPSFEITHQENFPFELKLTSQTLVQLHLTFSDHLRLPEKTRENLLAELSDLAENQFGGEVSKPYETALVIAKRR